ncbi:MAG: DUF11 domain-containing protein [Holophagales bacterium]|nr:DUF11 domain-containing protein [Holophagales bacterium]
MLTRPARILCTASILACLGTASSWAGVGSSDLSISKTDGATVSVIGGSVTYTIVGTNNGPDDVFGATVTDSFPSVLTCSWTCAASAGSSCTASGSGDINDSVTLLDSGTVTYTAVCTISGSASPGTLANTATISSAAIDGDPANNSATDSNSLVPTADLSITKTDGVTTAAPGGSVTYMIVASNAGPLASFGTTVTDSFPSDLSCTWTCAASVGSSCSASGTGDISDPVSLASGGTATYTATCGIALTATGTLSNTATIAGTVFDPNLGNESATDSDTVLSPSTDLSVAKADSVDPVTAGNDLTYTLTVTNNGPSNSTGATVTDVLPAGTTFSSSGDCTEAAGTVTCAVGALAPSASQPVAFTVTVDPAQTAALSNTATVAANETDPNAANDSATEGTAVGTEANLGITKVDSADPVTTGDAFRYTITVTNAGPSSASAVSVLDTLPAGVTLVGTSGCAEDPNGVPTCSLGDLAAGASASYQIDVTAPASAGMITNTATVSSATPDPDGSNDSASETTTVDIPVADLSITKDDGVDTVPPGGSVSYTIVAANAGPADAISATVEDTFPPELTCTWTCTAAGGASCAASGSGDIAESVGLPNGGTATFEALCDVDPGATGTLSNTATVSSTATDPDLGNNSATDVDTLGPVADLSVTAITVPDPADLGDTVLLEVTVRNDGPSDATGVFATSTLPSGLTFESTTGCAEDPGGVPVCTLGTIPAGTDAFFVVETTATAPGTTSGTLTVEAESTDPDGSDDTVFPSVTIGSIVDIPVLDTAGLLALLLLFAATGLWALHRRQ